jgi:phosphate starvation-inducible protein PhoH
MLKLLAVEIAADAREQVGLVGRVDRHLQAFADRRQAAAHHRHPAVDLVVQQRVCQAMSEASWRRK